MHNLFKGIDAPGIGLNIRSANETKIRRRKKMGGREVKSLTKRVRRMSKNTRWARTRTMRRERRRRRRIGL